jgi:putative DNA primase/helicase
VSWQTSLQTKLVQGAQVTLSTAHNIHLILLHDVAFKGAFRFNLFSQQIDIGAPDPWEPARNIPPATPPRALQDNDLFAIKRYFSAVHQFEARPADILGQVQAVARAHGYDPLTDYLRSVKWDGVARLDGWLPKYFGTEDSVYTRRVSVMWPVSAVARALRPGCKVDTMLIAEGPQGILKSSAFRVLAGPEFFADTESGDLGSKDSLIAMRGVWIKEAPELQSVRRADVERVKAFLSSCEDKFRLPYDKFDTRFPRRSVLVGTTNAEAYQQDETGARRFWPVLCTRINLKGLAAIRDQFWAEAVHRLEAGEPYWISPEDPDIQHFIDAGLDRTETDAWSEQISEWMDGLNEPVTTREEVFMQCLETLYTPGPSATDVGSGARPRPDFLRTEVVLRKARFQPRQGPFRRRPTTQGQGYVHGVNERLRAPRRRESGSEARRKREA